MEEEKNKAKKYNKNSESIYKKWWVILVVILFLIIAGNMTNDSSVEKEVPSKENAVNLEKVKPLSYDIVEKENVSAVYDGKTAKRMSYRVVLGTELKKEQIRPTVESIINDLRQDDSGIDSIHLLLYTTEDRSQDSYDIAMAQWAPGGKVGNLTGDIISTQDRSNYETRIEIKNDLKDYLERLKETKDKFGFSKEERKEIFKNLVRCEDVAYEEARKYYDPACSSCSEYIKDSYDDKYNKEEDLIAKCKEEIRVENNITKEEQTEISVEGSTKNWPLPEFPPVPDCCEF